MTDYSNWTLDALQARFVESGAEFTRLSNERQDLLAEMDARKARSEAIARVGALSEKEKDALRDVLGAKVEVSDSGIAVVSK